MKVAITPALLSGVISFVFCMKMGKWRGIINRSIGAQWINIYDIQEPEYKLEDKFSILCGM